MLQGAVLTGTMLWGTVLHGTALIVKYAAGDCADGNYAAGNCVNGNYAAGRQLYLSRINLINTNCFNISVSRIHCYQRTVFINTSKRPGL